MATTLRFHSFFSIAFAITVSIISLSTFSLIEATNGGFSVDLIHRDSSKSPFYNPSLTPSQLVINAFRRSVNRVSHFVASSVSPNAASTEVIPGVGEYLMKISVGTPPFEILVVVDTGSDLIWTQCKPCTRCFKQKAPIFDPKNSSTYKELSCSSRTCQSLLGTRTCHGSCQYSMHYMDRSYSYGVLSTETITLGSSTSLPRIIFGCGHNDVITSFSEDMSGIVGLGGGEASLISQLGSSIDGKFSYCLVPFFFKTSKRSKMNFGDKGVVSGAGVVSTPIVPKSPVTYYHLTLEGITIGSERLEFYINSSSPSDIIGEGNIIIDSGTTLTWLPSEFYLRVESAMKKETKLVPVEDPERIFNLCYRIEKDMTFPIVTVHFRGADVKLNPMNTFLYTSKSVFCLAILPTQRIAIYGNLAQMNFLVGYDLQKKTVSFKPTNCAQH